jgi:hypothetical protein
MVVLVIIMLLAGLILTAMRPAIEERRMREAARTVSTMFYQAKARAIETGRPFGVWIEVADNGDPQAPSSRLLYYAESPPVYAGDSEDAAADVKAGGYASLSGANTSLIKEGDFIRFNFQDPYYRIITGGDNIQFAPTTPGTPLPEPEDGVPMRVPFQVLRKPRKAMGAPVQLTGNVVVDLTMSGTGATGREFAQAKSKQLVILFSPAGHIDRVYTSDQASFIPTSPVHLLLGRNEKVPDGTNLQDPLNLWVSVGNQSGLVTTSHIDLGEGGNGGDLKTARKDAASMLGMGGR